MTCGALAALALAPAHASACGGFFCDAAQPVNQAAERIIFAPGPDGSVTAVIQIQYSGPSEEFAWMLPVPGDPEIGVSSNSAFARLQRQTNPTYRLNTTVEGTCRDGDVFASGRGAGPTAELDAGAAPENDDVSVVNQGQVGPYDFVVIRVDPAAENVSDVATTWLQDEGYDVNEFGADRLAPYLEGGMNLLAFRLTKGNDAGSIRPVTIDFGTGLPSIPIRPTAVAATDDMGVMVWVLGDHRAVPVNYLSLELNEALINWLQPNSNYNDVVTRAANEAGGQGFVTEFAGPSEGFELAIYNDFERDAWARLEGQDWSASHGALLQEALNTFGQHDGIRDVIRRTVPVPAGVSEDELVDCPFCFLDIAQARVEGFDPALFLDAMRTEVIEPLAETRAMFEQSPYLTRLYTTMSADEMTVDPIFDYNASLPELSNQHEADRVIECSPSVFQNEAPWRVLFEDGTVVRGQGQDWPFDLDGSMPANRTTRRIGSEGAGRVIDDNVATIAAQLEESNATIPTVGGCAVDPASGSGGFRLGLLLAFGALLLGRRRWTRRDRRAAA